MITALSDQVAVSVVQDMQCELKCEKLRATERISLQASSAVDRKCPGIMITTMLFSDYDTMIKTPDLDKWFGY